MADFLLKIAEHVAQVHSLFESTPQYFRPYLTDEPAEFSVTVTKENIDFEQADLLEEAHRDGFKPRVFTDPFLERAAIQRAFAEYLLAHDIILFHGSAIAVDGEGFLFTAHSGTGKSTHTRLWREVFGSRAVMVNDDKPFLQITESGVILHGSPWSGKHGLDANVSVPLKGLCFLERGAENTISPAATQDLMPILHKQCYFPLDERRHQKVSQLLDSLAQTVPLWHLRCNKQPEAAQVSFEAMHL